MDKGQRAFQINGQDNVATALDAVSPGAVILLGDTIVNQIAAVSEIVKGHKIALRDIGTGEDIVKYGVRIGRATKDIPAGSWVHLHNICSVYDSRSSHLDAVTGAPTDIKYE